MRIYSVEIINNPVLGNINLDFTDAEGNIIDTIIFAGENGCGKTTLLECLSLHNNNLEENESRNYILEIDEKTSEILKTTLVRVGSEKLYRRIVKADYRNYKINGQLKTSAIYYDEQGAVVIRDFQCNFPCVYLTPEINFFPDQISSVTSKNTDSYAGGLQKSNKNIATEITQLIIDIATQDKFDFSELYDLNPRGDYSVLQRSPRISRFNYAFSKIIPDFSIKKVENAIGNKVVTFYNRGQVVPISKLSSGEKQIVFRGGYLLKDMNASKGALILIDEPELSLHPEWQKKILDYYKAIFTDEKGYQTSQIFIATHSPYIIHNKTRKNDKVIVLRKDENAKVTVMDKPEYYACGDVKVIEDAFNDKLFSISPTSTVYLEGRTDEMYFKKALEVFDIKGHFQFKWVGYIDVNKKERNTGKDSLNQAKEFLIAHNLNYKNICLYDCDANKNLEEKNNIVSYSIAQYKSNMRIGIENALNLENVDVTPYYEKKVKVDDYGAESTITTLDKMKMCKDICSKNNEELKIIFSNLKTEIEKIIKIINGN